ncbi:hypothetical protein ABZ864_17115 [Streptomyces sp. NPDC047082]
MTGIGFALSLLLGLGLTHLYDRRGLHRTAQLAPVALATAA